MKIILASQSPRRRELLTQMGLKFDIQVPQLDESAFSEQTPEALVRTLSREKAVRIAAACAGDELVIAADTVVVLDGKILGKPSSQEEARTMLASLSGRTHEVYTGFTVCQGERQVTEHAVTAVTFRCLTEKQCVQYVETGEPMDKAGAYGIQGYGALLVERLDGDYFNVMGLPVNRLGQVLETFGVDCLGQAAEQRDGEAP